MLDEKRVHTIVEEFCALARRKRLKRAFHREEWVIWSVRYDSNLIGSYRIFVT